MYMMYILVMYMQEVIPCLLYADCFLHHMLWQDYRVVLLVPLSASGGLKVL